MSDILKDPKYAPLDLTAPAPQIGIYQPELSAADEKRNLEIAMKIWKDSAPIAGTPAEKYLREARHITCDLPEVLRFHPACYHGPTKSRHPALIALYTGSTTNKPQGVHRTFLKPDGTGKADIDPQRLTLGNSLGAVVRLVDDAEVTYGLGLAEGIETALSVMSMGWQPVWAALSSGNISNFPILPAVTLTIFADHDLPDKDGLRVGQDAARKCAERWAAGGREAFIKTPLIEGYDFNDVLMTKGQK